jgi:hypothetical protein
MIERGLLLILVSLLLFDLTDDGFLNKAKFVPPHSAAQISQTFKTSCHSEPEDSRYTLPSQNFPEAANMNQFRIVSLLKQPAFTITTLCNNGSSGGIPL